MRRTALLLLRWSGVGLLSVLLLGITAQAPASAQAYAPNGFGRLFNSAQERQALDARRGKTAAGPGANMGANSAANSAVVPDVAPGGGAVMPPPLQSDVPQRMPPEMGGGLPPGTPNMPGMQPGPLPEGQQMPYPNSSPSPSPAGGADTAGATPPPPAPEQLTMNGVLRTSNGRSTVWLNNVPQRGDANKFSNRNRQAITVTLPSGKRVVLQPGQRYDLADGRVKDISQP